MRKPTSPCIKCPRNDICDDCDEVCVRWRKWFEVAWNGMKRRALRGTAALHLYHAGKNDQKIANAVGVSSMTICQWRKRNGLPPAGRRGPHPESEDPTC